MILQYVSNTGIQYFVWVLQHKLVHSAAEAMKIGLALELVDTNFNTNSL